MTTHNNQNDFFGAYLNFRGPLFRIYFPVRWTIPYEFLFLSTIPVNISSQNFCVLSQYCVTVLPICENHPEFSSADLRSQEPWKIERLNEIINKSDRVELENVN